MATTQTEDETRKVVALLGGQGIFPGKIKDARDLQTALRKGLPYATFEAVLKVLDLNSLVLAQLVGVASRTLARRKTAQLLSPIESDRLYRIARMTLHASEVLGSLEKARTWLRQENRALGGDSPVSQLDTEIGERRDGGTPGAGLWFTLLNRSRLRRWKPWSTSREPRCLPIWFKSRLMFLMSSAFSVSTSKHSRRTGKPLRPLRTFRGEVTIGC